MTAPDMSRASILPAAAVLLALMLLALARPIDHDESQYVAAAVLAWHGLPYRDFAYLQTPLQPLLLAPVAALAGTYAYPALRLINAVLGAIAIGAIYAAAREAGVRPRLAMASAGLFAACDIFLFSVSVARNDSLPVALYASALWLIVRASNGRGSLPGALLAGLLLAGAGAAKISYTIPAIAYGGYALVDRRHRPFALLAGAAPMLALVGWLYALAPAAFRFGVFDFPVRAPIDWYANGSRANKLTITAKLVDSLKFLALGPALLAIGITLRRWTANRQTVPFDILIIAGLVAALLPAPTWRQYLLPVLPALFIRMAIAWEAWPPGAAERIAAIIFACAGVAPSIEALGNASQRGLPMAIAARESAAIKQALDAAGVTGPIATLSPQFIPATGRQIDPRFATGPFYFRSRCLLSARDERKFGLVSRGGSTPITPPPAALLIGGEAPWTSGNAGVDADLLAMPGFAGWARVPLASTRFSLYVPRSASIARAPRNGAAIPCP